MDKQPLLDLYTAFAGAAPQAVDAITGSGSNRQYFRLTSAAGHTVIGVIGTSVEENHAFITLAHHFREKGLSVPQVLAVSADERCYLQEDLGSRSLFDALKDGREAGGQYSEREQELLRRTIAQLPRLQILGGQGLDFSVCYPQPEMDETNVMFDLNYFKYCFLKPSGIDFHELRLEQDFRQLAKNLMDPPPSPSLAGRGVDTSHLSTFLYRDFQARNVMLDADGNPCFIDFQGGRRGPIYYDLASFLWQASARYPQALREELIAVYRKSLEDVLGEVQEFKGSRVQGFKGSSFKFQVSSFRLFVLFRLLQVLGAYGYRGYFERKKHFLDSIPPALDNLRDLLKDEGSCPYPELRKVLEALDSPPNPLSCKEGEHTSNQIPLSCKEGEHTSNQIPLSCKEGENTSNQIPLSTREGCPKGGVSLVVRVFSFSFKRGIPEDESGNGGGYVFDCRSTHNPGRYEPYKQLTGLDAPVIKFLEDDGEILTFLDSVYRLADAHVERYLQRGFTDLMFSFGCTGGQHRSVYSAQHLAEHLHAKYGIRVILNHREQGIHKVLE